MEFDVYFDESGDLGWSLDEVYRSRGSSQYFTIAYLILPKESNKHINRFIKKFHKERGGLYKEIKGANISNGRAKVMAKKIANIFERDYNVTIGAVTVKKRGVPIRVTDKGNSEILYNYMVQHGICSKISSFNEVRIIPDKKSVPKGSANSCSDLIKSELWFNYGSETEIEYSPEESHHNESLMFIDWIANFIWRHYENGYSTPFNILRPHIEIEELYF